MNSKLYLKSLALVFLFVVITGCAGRAECGVQLDGDFPIPVVNPPGEKAGSGFVNNCTYEKNMSIGETTQTTYDGSCDVEFEESGNVYIADLYVVIIDGKVTEYRVEVTGGVYGQEAHICTK